MIEVTDLAIEPEVDSRNWRRREVTESCQQRAGGQSFGQDASQCIEGNSKQKIIELLLLSVGRDNDLKALRAKRLHAYAKLNFSAA